MDLVIDSNVLFAALIKKGVTSELLFKHTLFAPEFIFEEFKKYKGYLKRRLRDLNKNSTSFMTYLRER